MALEETIQAIRIQAPDVPVILDAKRGGIGTANAKYAKDAFYGLRADAITVHPYLGRETTKPFLDRADKGVIVRCRTPNPGAGEFQDLVVDGEPLYLRTARNVATSWNTNNNCAVVAAATYPDELRAVRLAVGDIPILIPDIDAQRGDLAKTVAAGKDSRGRGMIIHASQSIIFASSGTDFAQAARREAEALHRLIGQCLG
jgi:orotidine-5'-phosphate decarboxylase